MNTTMRVPSALRRHAARLLLPLVAATLLLAAGCAPSSGERALDRAEAVMEQHPDSALAILQAVDGSTLKGELRARHALLLSQALDKNYIDIADDSIISVAYDYYTAHSDNTGRLATTCYYRAVTAYNAADYQGGIYYATLADTLAARVNDIHTRAMAHSLLAWNSSALLHFERQRFHAGRAVDFFTLDNDSVRASSEMLNLAISLMQLDMPDSALAVLDKPGCKQGLHTRASCLLLLGRLKEAQQMFSKHPELADNAKLLANYARQLITIGDTRNARITIDSAFSIARNTYDSASCYGAQAALFKSLGDWHGYSGIIETNLEIMNSDLNKRFISSRTAGSVEALLYLADHDRMELSAKKQAVTMWLSIGIIVILLLIAAIVLTRSRMIIREKDFELALADAKAGFEASESQRINLKQQVSELRKADQILRDRCERLAQENDTILTASHQYGSSSIQNIVEKIRKDLNNVCSEYYELSDDDRDGRTRIKKDIEAILTVDNMAILEYYVNIGFDQVIQKARDLKVKKTDIDVLILEKCGFSNNETAILLGLQSKAAVASRKTRMHKILG